MTNPMGALRTSSYLISVKLENEQDKYMLVHGYTGAMDIVSLDMLERINTVSIANTFSSEMEQKLLRRGYITEKTQDEEYVYVARMSNALHQKMRILHSSFTWVVTYNCNFRCPYCFENRECKDGELQFVFTKGMVDSAYYAMEQIQPIKDLRKSTIILYGGEPLMAENKEIVDYIVTEGKKRGYSFYAITNGYDLEEYVHLFGADMIKQIQITIDGTREMHNKRRIHYLGYDTFDKIINNISLALAKGVMVNVRMNTDYHSIEKLVELRKYFSQLGFMELPNFKFYSAELRDNTAITEMERSKLEFKPSRVYIERMKQNDMLPICQDYGINKIIYDALKNKKPIALRSVYCSSQTNEYVLDPLGNIYPCMEIIGKQNFRIGSYKNNELLWNESVLNEWRNVNILNDSSCSHCCYSLICGGGCPYHSFILKEKRCSAIKTLFSDIVNSNYVKFNSY